MKLSSVQKAFLAVIIANIIWGAAAPIFKISLTNVPPFTLAFWRFFLGALILLAFLGKKAKMPTMTRSDFKLLVGYALSGITVNIIFFFWGLQRTLAVNSPVIAAGAPILTFFLALIFLRERFDGKKLTGMLLGTAGIIVIVMEPILETGVGGSLIGNLFLVTATLAAVVQTIIGRRILPRFNPFAFTFWAFIIGSASFLPLAAYEYLTIPQLYQSLTINGYMGIAYGALFSSAMAYGLYAWGLAKISATDASLFTYIDPVIGTMLSVFILNEPITTYFLLGGLLIFGGIFVAEGKIHYHPIHRLWPQSEAPLPIPQEGPPTPQKHPKINKKEVLAAIFAKKPDSEAR